MSLLAKMSNFQVCRICLVMNVKMFDLRKKPLETYFEPIIGINPLSMVNLPSTACFECAALIKKYYFFRDKCIRGQTTLYALIQNTGQITEETLKQLDREQFKLCSNLKTHNTVDCVVNQCEIDILPIKVEDHISVYLDLNEPSETFPDLKEEVDIKDNVDDFINCPSPDMSSDNEPLSVHKMMKQKKEKKKKIKKKKNAVLEDKVSTEDEPENAEDVTDMFSEAPESAEAAPARKRGRPRKGLSATHMTSKKRRRTKNTSGIDDPDDDINIEDFVTVVKLSLQEQLDEVTQRQTSANYVNARYQCSLCYKGFLETAAWKNHVSKHSPSAGDEECPVCRFRFKTKRSLQKHVFIHEKKYFCKSCPYVSRTATQAKQHQRWHRGVTYKCQYCDEVSTKWTSHLSHVRIKHPSQHVCGECGYSFVSKLGLAMHRTMMHKNEGKQKSLKAEQAESTEPERTETADTLYCAECDVQFSSVEAWKRHTANSSVHTQGKTANTFCKECGESFVDPESCRLHHRKVHARTRPRNYGKKTAEHTWPMKCKHCPVQIGDAREHWVHFRRAHRDLPYPLIKAFVCEICGKSFRGNAFLVYHMRTHQAERQFTCDKCPKSFFNRANLQIHEKTHSDHRPYPCTACFKAFKNKGSLDRHFRSHTGEKPYPCEVCGKSFGQSNSRKIHVRTVHLKQADPYAARHRAARRRTHDDTAPHPRDTGSFGA